MNPLIIDASSLNGSGSKLCLEPLRPTNYDSQLWQFDQVTHRLINKGSGLAISAEELADEAFVSQSSSLTEQDLSSQAWTLGASGTLRLKSNPQFLLGFKKDNWFNLKSETANVLLQKADQRVHSYQKFVLALPIFKKKTTEIVSATAQIGVFPEGYFFIKNQKHGLVVSVLETEKLAAHVLASPLDSQNYNRQLWTHKDGFLINKASQFVLDVRGGCIVNGSELCQYKQKKVGYENQQWGLTVEGFIHAKTHEGMVLALDKNIGEKPTLALAHKKTPDHEEQRWNFVLPVFKHKSASVTEKTVQKSIVYHRFAQYPSGWFFIRSFEGSKDKPLVLTASGTDDSLTLTEISQTEWRHQLWMHQNGGLINFASQLSLDVKNIAVNTVVYQEIRHTSESQRWILTTEGVLIHGSNAALSLVPENTESGYKLKLAEQQTIEHRWGLLSPETKVENSLQVLSSWKSVLLTECKKLQGKYVQKIVHRLADWPQETFYISAQEGYALVPERLESYATVTVKKLEFGHYEQFRWTYRDGYLVHVATGLVLHASDELIGGSELQIRERLVSENRIDERQRWVLKTDGSIVAETKTSLGFALLKQDKEFRVQLAYVSKTSEHYTWGFVHGHYETRYSNVYKKDMTVLTRLERILLTVRQSQGKNTFPQK
ncbi:hypothetical protein G6F56_008961 [Rhizopus delemar]|nr:hypothetical protein G6F56_008961 [Rhizopus delemar]